MLLLHLQPFAGAPQSVSFIPGIAALDLIIIARLEVAAGKNKAHQFIAFLFLMNAGIVSFVVGDFIHQSLIIDPASLILLLVGAIGVSRATGRDSTPAG